MNSLKLILISIDCFTSYNRNIYIFYFANLINVVEISSVCFAVISEQTQLGQVCSKVTDIQ